MPSSARRYKPPRSPGQRVAKRNARKEEQIKCVLAPRRPLYLLPRDGSIDFAEGPSVPEGKAKSALAPIRRPPSRAEGHCTGARLSGLFFWTVHGPFSFPQDGKENGGCIPLDQPLAGAKIPEAAVRRPASLPRGVPPNRGALPLYFSSNTDTYTVPLTSNPSLAFT